MKNAAGRSVELSARSGMPQLSERLTVPAGEVEAAGPRRILVFRSLYRILFRQLRVVPHNQQSDLRHWLWNGVQNCMSPRESGKDGIDLTLMDV